MAIPIDVVDGTVLVATIGATVAATTGVAVLNMGFCDGGEKGAIISVTENEKTCNLLGRHQ